MEYFGEGIEDEVLDEKINEALENIDDVLIDNMFPTRNELKICRDIVTNFIKLKERLVYGSYGMNLLLIKYGDTLYKTEANGLFSDIDFYSSDPYNDWIELSNLLYDAGLQKIKSREAQHEGTFNIKIGGKCICDITLQSQTVIDRFKIIEIDGFKIVHPHYMFVSFLRIYTDPLTSWDYALQKNYKRIRKILKYYPLLKIEEEIGLDENDEMNSEIRNEILEYLNTVNSYLLVGAEAFNIFFIESGINKDYIKQIPIRFIEVVSDNYIEDAQNIYYKLVEKYGNDVSKKEYYQFCDYYGFSVEIFIKNKLCLRIYENTKGKCNTMVEHDNFQFGSFSYVLMFLMIRNIYSKVYRDNTECNILKNLTSQMIEIRNYYLKHQNKTIFDEGIFQDMNPRCVGEGISHYLLYDNLIQERIELTKQNKRRGPFTVEYYPEKNRQEPNSKKSFVRIDGHEIGNDKYLKIKIDN